MSLITDILETMRVYRYITIEIDLSVSFILFYLLQGFLKFYELYTKRT